MARQFRLFLSTPNEDRNVAHFRVNVNGTLHEVVNSYADILVVERVNDTRLIRIERVPVRPTVKIARRTYRTRYAAEQAAAAMKLKHPTMDVRVFSELAT